MMNDGTLKTGSLVTVPASYRAHGRERRTAVVETVSLNGLWFCDTTGVRHHVADAGLVPLADAAAQRGHDVSEHAAETDAPVLIGRCTVCGQAFRVELAATAQVLPGAHWRLATSYARTAGFLTWHGCRSGVRCAEGENGLPECGDWECEGHDLTEVRYRVLRSTYKPEVSCNAGTCGTATGSSCTCSCAGRNHGSAWRVS